MIQSISVSFTFAFAVCARLLKCSAWQQIGNLDLAFESRLQCTLHNQCFPTYNMECGKYHQSIITEQLMPASLPHPVIKNLTLPCSIINGFGFWPDEGFSPNLKIAPLFGFLAYGFLALESYKWWVNAYTILYKEADSDQCDHVRGLGLFMYK